jgi:HSP20 family protein
MSGKNNKQKKNAQTGLMRRQSDLPAAGDFPFFGTTPFTMMRRFMDDMDRMLEDFGQLKATPFFNTEMAFPRWTEFEKTMWSPQVEIRKRDGDMIVRADLPGLKREDINVEIADGALTLSGERKEETEEKKEGFYHSERTYGGFFRSIPLPENVTPENATAKFENGVLEVKIAIPATESGTHKIEIQAGAPEAPKAFGAGK